MVSYDAILKNMKNAYFEQTGENPDMQGDLGIRFKAVASQIFDMGVNADFVLKQSNWKKASGENLDAIAYGCGVVRKQPRKATGELTFYVDEATDSDIVIPKGTICSKFDESYLQYVTDSECVIYAGGRGTTVSATATHYGDQYNVDAETVTVMVNPPKMIDGVSNSRFYGGGNLENDEELRERIAKAMGYPHNGICKEYLQNRIEQLDEILSVGIAYSDEIMGVYCKTRDSQITQETRKAIDDMIGFCTYAGVDYFISVALPVDVDLYIEYTGDCSSNDIEQAVKRYMKSLGVGQNPSAMELEKLLHKDVDAQYVEIKITPKNIGANEYARIRNIEVIGDD